MGQNPTTSRAGDVAVTRASSPNSGAPAFWPASQASHAIYVSQPKTIAELIKQAVSGVAAK